MKSYNYRRNYTGTSEKIRRLPSLASRLIKTATVFLIVGQLIAVVLSFVQDEVNSEFRRSAMKQNVEITRIRTATVRESDASSRTPIQKTIYKIQFKYHFNGEERLGNIISRKTPYFESGDTVTAWVDPQTPTESKIHGLEDAFSPLFIHLAFAGLSWFFFSGFAIFVVAGETLIGKIQIKSVDDSLKV